MGIIKNNPMMATASGTVGFVYFRKVRGKLIVCNRPPKGRKFTPAQLECQERFGKASKQTKALLKDPATKKKYQAQTNNQKFTAHMVAQSELMKGPVANVKVKANVKGNAKVKAKVTAKAKAKRKN